MVTDLAHFIGETTDYDKKQQLEVNKPKSWCKSVSAFANGRGGFLIFGVADDDTVTGLENPQFTGAKSYPSYLPLCHRLLPLCSLALSNKLATKFARQRADTW